MYTHSGTPYVRCCAWGVLRQAAHDKVYKNMRYEVVKMVENHQIETDGEKRIVELPEKYKKCSSGGDILVYQNDDESMVGFWVKRGFLDSGFTMFVYKSDDNSMDIE